ncbi:MAG: DOPA 4,5-dioxygenase family protein [Proteobacteria bacterium]|nr:DOPA 4,5-dioxygenase family protein [Pseudomonadota bacterium]
MVWEIVNGKKKTTHEDDFNRTAKKQGEPYQPPVQDYDIHIYFESDAPSKKTAGQVALEIKRLFPDAVLDIHRLDAKVGPHTAPNWAVNITPESFGEVVSWLQRHSEGLSILIHPHTGDEIADHTNSALWLGKPIELNIAFFEKSKPTPPKGPSL